MSDRLFPMHEVSLAQNPHTIRIDIRTSWESWLVIGTAQDNWEWTHEAED